MASEILVVPEEHLAFTIEVIRRGLFSMDNKLTRPNAQARKALHKWCDEEERYLRRMQEE